MGPAENAEGQFHYLNRSARPQWATVRAVMESWFAEYPLDHQRDLLGRIRDDDTQHNGAYFELLLYTMFSRLGFTITVHPSVPGGKGNPDFLLESAKMPPFYLEAKVVTGESEQSVRDRHFWEEIQDFINRKRSSNFFVSVHLVSSPSTQPPLKKIRAAMLDYIDSADREEVEESIASEGRNRIEKWFDIKGWRFIVSLLPKSSNNLDDRLVEVSFQGLFPVTDIQDIQSAIEDKAGSYGDISTPYIIATNMLSYGAGSSDFISALFGKYEEYPARGDGTLPGLGPRSPDSALRWRGSPRNTRVSAVIGFRHALPWHIPDLYVCPNPWAQYPLPPLPRLPRLELIDDRFVPVAGDPLKEILGLPPNWPEE